MSNELFEVRRISGFNIKFFDCFTDKTQKSKDNSMILSKCDNCKEKTICSRMHIKNDCYICINCLDNIKDDIVCPCCKEYPHISFCYTKPLLEHYQYKIRNVLEQEGFDMDNIDERIEKLRFFNVSFPLDNLNAWTRNEDNLKYLTSFKSNKLKFYLYLHIGNWNLFNFFVNRITRNHHTENLFKLLDKKDKKSYMKCLYQSRIYYYDLNEHNKSYIKRIYQIDIDNSKEILEKLKFYKNLDKCSLICRKSEEIKVMVYCFERNVNMRLPNEILFIVNKQIEKLMNCHCLIYNK